MLNRYRCQRQQITFFSFFSVWLIRRNGICLTHMRISESPLLMPYR